MFRSSAVTSSTGGLDSQKAIEPVLALDQVGLVPSILSRWRQRRRQADRRRGSACRSEIASLGDFLFDMLSPDDELATVVDRIAAMDEANKARRSAILDECWDELGVEDEE